MKQHVFAFFMEPSSYTGDLINHIYAKHGIDYIFIQDSSLAKSAIAKKGFSLREMPFFKQLFFILHVYKQNSIIIFNGYNRWEFLLLFILNLLSPTKRILAIESDTQFKHLSGLKAIVKYIYLKIIFSNSYVFGFSGGSASHHELFRYYGMPEKHIFLMPMVVNNERFYCKEEKISVKFTFLYVGRLIPLKNIKTLIEAFQKVFVGQNDVILKIIGNGELFEFYKESYLDVQNIIFTGSLYDQDLVNEYHQSDVLILPSYEEQWGLVVNEALCASLPVIVSDQVGAKYDLVMGQETGFVFQVDNIEDLSSKMLALYEDKGLYQYYSSNAVKLMKKHWNYELYEKNLLEAIQFAEKLLKRGK